MRNLRNILLMIALLSSTIGLAQRTSRFEETRKALAELAKTQTGLNGTVELAVSGVSIQEFVRGIGEVNKLNISIDPNIRYTVYNNFSNATVSDVLLFLVKQYNLEIEFVGSIMILKPYVEPEPVPEVYQPKQLNIVYNNTTDFLSLDLKRDSLSLVAKAITEKTLKNVVPAPGTGNQLVSVYIKNRPFDNALEKMAEANSLRMEKTDDGFYWLKPAAVNENQEPIASNQNGRRSNSNGRNSRQTSGQYERNNNTAVDITISQDSLVTVSANNIPLADLVKDVSDQMYKSYFLFNEPQGNTSLYVENVTFEDFLTYVLNGTDYTFKYENKVYLIGERNLERLRTTEMFMFQNRTVETVMDFIPSELQADVDIKEFLELNSLILSGSHPKIQELKRFLSEVDRVVPVVMIDVIIVDVDRSNLMKTGINMSFGSGEVGSTSGAVGGSNGVGFELNSGTLNELIDQFNGFGIINLGKVAPDFQASLSALETASVIRKRSTPKLATMNGHEASMSIGETEYYLETQNNVVGNNNVSQNLITQSQQYRSVQADLSVTIRPIVSGDNQVTLEITVEESSFTDRISPSAPPGMKTTSFTSKVRVRNEEMLLMGGLEKKLANNTTEGLPFVARIPVLRFFFSEKINQHSKAKLHVFIKPTIIY